MIKSIKKLFSIDESELDFDEIEDTEEKSSLYQQELNQYTENQYGREFSAISSIEEQGNKFKEIEEDPIITTSSPESISRIANSTFDTSKNEDANNNPNLNANVTSEMNVKNTPSNTTIPVVETKNMKSVENDVVNSTNEVIEKTDHRSFDFASDIDEAYEVEGIEELEEVIEVPKEPTKPVIKELKVKKIKEIAPEPTNKQLNTDELVNKDNYVLKDIISPMRGVIRRETNSIKRDEEHKKAQIIKLREHVTATEIDPVDENMLEEVIEFPFTDTKKIDMSQLDHGPKETLSETSKFTLIEDSTGEMRLVIDDDE